MHKFRALLQQASVLSAQGSMHASVQAKLCLPPESLTHAVACLSIQHKALIAAVVLPHVDSLEGPAEEPAHAVG